MREIFNCVHPCPCGFYGGSQKPCTCAQALVTKYQKRISGPLLDRIDIHIEVPRVDYEKRNTRQRSSYGFQHTNTPQDAFSFPHTSQNLPFYSLLGAFLPLILTVIIPLIYMSSMAFTLEANHLKFPPDSLLHPITISNFTHIFADKTLPIARWFGNRLLVATLGTLIVVFFSSQSGYAFARLEFPFKNVLFSLLLFSLMIPAAVTLIPAFLLLRELKLLNIYYAIWWPAVAFVIGIFLMRQHFYAIPRDMEDAALVDGDSRFRIYWQVCLPLVSNALIALFIFTFLGLWNDLFWPLIVIIERNTMNLPVGLVVIQQDSYIQRGLAFAGAFIASIPVLLFYATFQRRLVAGMAGQYRHHAAS